MAPIERYDFLLVAYTIVTFALSHTVYDKFDVKQSNDLEISPKVIDTGSKIPVFPYLAHWLIQQAWATGHLHRNR